MERARAYEQTRQALVAIEQEKLTTYKRIQEEQLGENKPKPKAVRHRIQEEQLGENKPKPKAVRHTAV